VARSLDKARATSALHDAVVNAINAPGETTAGTAATAQATLDKVTANRSTVSFGLAAGIGMALCGYLHANFLSAVGVTAPSTLGATAIAIVVTGVAVGGGSKQLHDLITNMSKTADAKGSPAETGGTS
jgi:hypothetical protein